MSSLAAFIWVLAFAGAFTKASAFDPIAWHTHEMVVSYAGAAIAGFLFTASPNWTNRPPPSGAPLARFAALQLAEPVTVLLGHSIGPWHVAISDVALLVVLAMVIDREISAGQNRRNLVVVVMLSLLASANFLTHLEPLELADAVDFELRLGIGIVVRLITLFGGRVMPGFTASWLRSQGTNQFPNVGLSNLDRVELVRVAA